MQEPNRKLMTLVIISPSALGSRNLILMMKLKRFLNMLRARELSK